MSNLATALFFMTGYLTGTSPLIWTSLPVKFHVHLSILPFLFFLHSRRECHHRQRRESGKIHIPGVIKIRILDPPPEITVPD